MSAISGFINTIRNAVYGEQVRGAIVSALEQCYSDVNSPSLQTAAFTAALNAAYAGGILDIQTVTQISAMTNQNIIYRYNGTQAGYQKGLYYYSPISSAWVLIGSEVHSVSLANQMTDTNSIYKYTGTQSGMVQNALYYYNGTAWVQIGKEADVDATLTQSGVPADAKKTGDEISDLKSDISSAESRITSVARTVHDIDNLVVSSSSGEIINYTTSLEVGAIGGDGQNTTAIMVNQQSCRTDYIDISNAFSAGFTITRVSGAKPGSTSEGNFYNYIYFYTANKTFISRSGGANEDDVTATVPSGAKYARVSFSFTAIDDVSNYTIFGMTSSESASHPIVDAVLGLLSNGGTHFPNNGLIMGDSISFGMWSYWDGTKRKNADDLYSDINQTAANPRISDYFADYFGIEIENISKRGTGWVADTRNLGNAWVKAQAIDFSEYGFVGLCYGINDWIQSRAIGTIEDNTVGTVIGNMIHTITKIYTDNPLCKVVVFSPLNTWGQWRDTTGELQTLYGDESSHYALGTANSAGYTLQQLIDAMESVCDRYDIRHVVMSQGCTINAINIKDVLIDGLHPSKASMKSIASDMFHAMLFK